MAAQKPFVIEHFFLEHGLMPLPFAMERGYSLLMAAKVKPEPFKPLKMEPLWSGLDEHFSSKFLGATAVKIGNF